MIADPLSYLGS